MGAPRRRASIMEDLERAADVIEEAPQTFNAEPAQAHPVTQVPEQPAPQNPIASEPAHRESAPQNPIVRNPREKSREIVSDGQGGMTRSGLNLDAIRALKVRKEPTVQINARIPVSLAEDIELLRSLTGITLTDIVLNGARAEVTRLKKLAGLD
jgi:hypothetical protein